MRLSATLIVLSLTLATSAAAAEATPASDMDCAVRYLVLAAAPGAPPEIQQTFMGRAVDAGQRHAKTDPSLRQQDLENAIRNQAQARAQKIGNDRSALMDLFIDIRLCDAKYGYPLTPFPPQAGGK
jgi:hypothetical protein